MYQIHERIIDLKSTIILLSIPLAFQSVPQLCLNLLINGLPYQYQFLHLHNRKYVYFKITYVLYYICKIYKYLTITSKIKYAFSNKQFG